MATTAKMMESKRLNPMQPHETEIKKITRVNGSNLGFVVCETGAVKIYKTENGRWRFATWVSADVARIVKGIRSSKLNPKKGN